MTLITPNHEKLKIISEIVREELYRHESMGGKYYDEHAGQIAARAIHTCMPELTKMQHTRLIVEAEHGVLLETDDVTSHKGVRVEAQLQRVAIQQLVILENIDGLPIDFSGYDLCAVLVPRYVDPDPQDIVFGQELYLPFSSIGRFESAA